MGLIFKSHFVENSVLRLLLIFRPFESQESDEPAGMAEVDAGGELAEAGVLGSHLLVALIEGERDLNAVINMFSKLFYINYLLPLNANSYTGLPDNRDTGYSDSDRFWIQKGDLLVRKIIG